MKLDNHLPEAIQYSTEAEGDYGDHPKGTETCIDYISLCTSDNDLDAAIAKLVGDVEPEFRKSVLEELLVALRNYRDWRYDDSSNVDPTDNDHGSVFGSDRKMFEAYGNLIDGLVKQIEGLITTESPDGFKKFVKKNYLDKKN